jgi:hypothetical protein
MLNFKPKKFLANIKASNNLKIIYTLCASIVLITLSIFNFSLFYWQKFQTINQKRVLGTQNEIERGLDYWYNIVSQHPNYIVAWLEIAKLENLRGNQQAVTNAIKFAEAIEPNLEELIKTKKELGL